MRLGVTFPQTESPADAGFIRDFAQAAEELGYTHLLAYDHVLGADPNRPGGWENRPYDKDDVFHEPFMMFAYLSGITQTIEFATGVIILPQRQAVLVAKQVAELDLISGGRFRLGIGTGWNPVEYVGLNENFHNRGRRQEEQVEVMRLLWENDVVDYTGRWHRIEKAGINPRPKRRIPVWFGGNHENVIKRAAKLGDGWMPLVRPGDQLDAFLGQLEKELVANGRSRADFGVDGVVPYQPDPERAQRQLEAWEGAGATNVTLRTLGTGLESPAAHLDAIRRFMEMAKGAATSA